MRLLAVTFFISCTLLSTHAATIQASEYYVSASTGSDVYSGGTRENPWATIKYALSHVSGSESNPAKICVARGTYYEYEITMKSYVSICGGYNEETWERNINACRTIVDGQYGIGDADTFNGANNATLDGLTIQNSVDDGVDCNTTSPTITNCRILKCTQGNGRGIAGENGVPLIRNNIFEGNKYGIQSSLQSLGPVIIENNLIIGSINCGISISSNAHVVNNTIDNSLGDNLSVGSGGTASPTLLIQNNNITRAKDDGIYISSTVITTGITIRYNNVYGNMGGNYVGQARAGTGDISKDPKYINPPPRWGSASDYDYHLASTSPSRDKGTDVDVPDHDLDGNPRPRGGRTDIGCYEYQPPPPTATPTPYPPFDVSVNSLSPTVGGPLRVDVTVPPCSQKFDAWGVIVGQGVVYSFVLGNPASVKRGAFPLIKGVSLPSTVYRGCLCNMPAIPAGAEGDYSIIVGLVPAGVSPRGIVDTIPGYAGQIQIGIKSE